MGRLIGCERWHFRGRIRRPAKGKPRQKCLRIHELLRIRLTDEDGCYTDRMSESAS